VEFLSSDRGADRQRDCRLEDGDAVYRIGTPATGAMAHKIYDLMTDDIAVLRARADRYRRLSRDLFDPPTSHEPAIIPAELETEIARLETRPEMLPAESDTGSPAQANCA